ncbi:MAG: hypothetical protein MUO59_04905, partial [Actinobacteria bacterium]|nr:hypothetical protein [Actinomycetota bacterium]
MKWQDIFNLGIKLGRECDIRNDPYSGDFEEDYSDCTIINGDPGIDVKKVYVAVDIGVGELLLAVELNKRGAGIDGIISHHPMGPGAYRLTDVIDIQRYNWERYGVDHKTAVSLMNRMIEDENIDIRARNLLAVGSASRLLEIPVMCMHTALDNIVQDFFDKLLNSRSFTKLEDVYKKIDLIPECIKASVNGDGPF